MAWEENDVATIHALAESVIRVAHAIRDRSLAPTPADSYDAKEYLRRAFTDLQRAARALGVEP